MAKTKNNTFEEYIEVQGARAHNLKDIDVKIPRDQLVVITGLSGSGKSSLAFDTIYAAFKRGVKIIGATSHYVTTELDAGPIIEQDVVHVSHTHTIKDLINKGRDLEKIVLSTAIKHHINQKVMVYGNKTVVFS